ncbi:MAG TPA: S-methyl-5-thioribose-1-phosphate isomerase [Caldithrix sp.]|nr:S-methyl-5-thioribose-1-phosphate isomerase [Caldithrix sp.]
METIVFENNTLKIIDQTVLPNKLNYLELLTLEEVINSIKTLKVRGAPAIGIVAAYGLYLHAGNLLKKNMLNMDSFCTDARVLANARPTAVNLSWAVDEMLNTFINYQDSDGHEILEKLKASAIVIHQKDKESCLAIGKLGSELISDSMNVLTHCNAGILATGGIGTALAPIYTAYNSGKRVHVYVDETRPVGQGARLTYWELRQNGIPATLITDNMAASLMQSKNIDLVIVGADRIAANGDVANKIGTYALAVLADFHKIPFYVAAPTSTIDKTITSGREIPIEERLSEEILNFWGIDSNSVKVYNPAFDITPHNLITAIITEKEIINKPIKDNLKMII